MHEESAIDRERVFVVEQQTVRVEDPFGAEDLILDLGGGGEGVVGQLRGRQVVALDIRKDELEESAPGPIKIVSDARSLPFLDASFDAVTAFFFLMYVADADRGAVLREAHRVLRPGGCLHIWDLTIPPRADRPQEMFLAFVKAELPDRTVETGYGVTWYGREMSSESVAALARDAGFAVVETAEQGETFRLVLVKATE
jgi:ubiquinone/menaquinone biosynthesis C-methylase UbiE